MYASKRILCTRQNIEILFELERFLRGPLILTKLAGAWDRAPTMKGSKKYEKSIFSASNNCSKKLLKANHQQFTANEVYRAHLLQKTLKTTTSNLIGLYQQVYTSIVLGYHFSVLIWIPVGCLKFWSRQNVTIRESFFNNGRPSAYIEEPPNRFFVMQKYFYNNNISIRTRRHL